MFPFYYFFLLQQNLRIKFIRYEQRELCTKGKTANIINSLQFLKLTIGIFCNFFVKCNVSNVYYDINVLKYFLV